MLRALAWPAPLSQPRTLTGQLSRAAQVSGDTDKSVLEVILTRRKKYTTQEINYGYTPKVH